VLLLWNEHNSREGKEDLWKRAGEVNGREEGKKQGN